MHLPRHFAAAVGVFAFAGASSAAAPASPVQSGTSARILVKLRAPLAREIEPALGGRGLSLRAGQAATPRASAFLSRHSIQSLKPLYPALVKAKRESGLTDRELALRVRAKFAARGARRHGRFEPPELTRTYVLEMAGATPQDVARALARLKSDPLVEFAEEEKVVAASLTPNDPYFGSSDTWNQPYDDLYGLKWIGAPAAWDTSIGTGVLVAVVDTGIDYNHPDLAANVWTNAGEVPANGVDDDGNGFVDDVRGWDFIGASWRTPAADADPADGDGHGTHVAGTVAAVGNNDMGVVGVAFGARVMAVKALDDDGYGRDWLLAPAIHYAIDNGADVINCSWGAEGASDALTEAMEYAHNLGAVIVAAAGNDNDDAAKFVPASLPTVISVAATTPGHMTASFSNWGRIDVAAPGEDILSLQAAGTYVGPQVSEGYCRASGTSMAAPHVSGLAALILGQHPAYSNEEVRQVIRTSAWGAEGGVDPEVGYGRIDAAAALAVGSVLEVKIKAPVDSTHVDGPVEILALARGAGFLGYTLDYGAGDAPSSWTLLEQCNAPSDGGPIGTFDPTTLPDGTYTLRLTATDAAGQDFVDQTRVIVDYARITSPGQPHVPSVASVLKPGSTITVIGTAGGPSFMGFRVEWARGLAPSEGWSEVGVSLTGAGMAPVDGGILATCTMPADTPADHYTIRLLVENAGFTSEARTLVYLEPDLLSTHWPRWLDQAPSDKSGVLAARDAVGQTRLTVVSPHYISSTQGASLRVYPYDGSSEDSYSLANASYSQHAVGDVDGIPGDETVVAEGSRLRVFRDDGTWYALEPSVSVSFMRSLVLLEDLDGDGRLDVIADALDFENRRAYLFAWSGTGAPLGGQFPLVVDDQAPYTLAEGRRFLVLDLNRDGAKEILLAERPQSAMVRLRLFSATGEPLPWAAPDIDGEFQQLLAADLDRDGSVELVVKADRTAAGHIHVLEPDGSVRPGWPVAVPGLVGLAVADLDRDGQDEILVSEFSRLRALRADGSSLSPAWPVTGYSGLGPVVAADVDADGYPEILVTSHEMPQSDNPLVPLAVDEDGIRELRIEREDAEDGSLVSRALGVPEAEVGRPRYYISSRLLLVRHDGTLAKSWALLGARGNQPVSQGATPLVGDFDGDGLADIAVAYRLISGGGTGGLLEQGVVTVLTTGAPLRSADQDWPAVYADARNTAVRSRPPSAPTVTIRVPAAGTIVSGTTTVVAEASGVAPLSVQLEVDGGAVGAPLLTPPYSFAWDTTAHANGAHTLEAVVRDASDRVASSQPVSVTILNTRPRADVGGPYSGLAGVPILFDGSSSSDPNGDPLTYAWDFGDGQTGSGPNPSHTYVRDAYYTVSLKVSDGVEASQASTTSAAVREEIPPAAVADLTVMALNGRSVHIDWTATGDDGTQGTGRSQELRYSQAPMDVGNFGSATVVPNVYSPRKSGTLETVTLSGLKASTTYYFALRVTDEWGNVSDLSNIAAVTMPPEVSLFRDDMESGLGQWTISGSDGKGGPALWHIWTYFFEKPGKSLYYGIDSKNSYYTGARNWGSAVSRSVSLVGARKPWLHFRHNLSRTDTEISRLGISSDGGATWSERAIAWTTGTPLYSKAIELPEYEGKIIQIKFEFDSVDAASRYERGWVIDDVEIVAESVNRPPTAQPGGPYLAAVGETIVFDGTASSDPEGQPLTYRWDFGDGTTATGAAPTHAFADGGSHYVSLVVNDGELDSSVAWTTVMITGPRELTVVVESLDGGSGSLRVAPAPLDGAPQECVNAGGPDPVTCTFSYPFGTTVTVSPAPGTHSRFLHWTGMCPPDVPCTLVLDGEGAVLVGAAFLGPRTLTLTLTSFQNGHGTVTVAPPPLNRVPECENPGGPEPVTCTYLFPPDTVATLSPSAASGSKFLTWFGQCSWTAPCEVPLGGAGSPPAAVEAWFQGPQSLTLTLEGIESGRGSVHLTPAPLDNATPECVLPAGPGPVTCTFYYPPDSVVALTAVAESDSMFQGWTSYCRGTESCEARPGGGPESPPTVVSGSFLGPRALVVTVTSVESGRGSVLVAPPPLNEVPSECAHPGGPDPVTCTYLYRPDTVVSLVAAAAIDSKSLGWDSSCSGMGPCEVVLLDGMSAPRVGASFLGPRSLTLTLNAHRGGAGAVLVAPAALDGAGACELPQGAAGQTCALTYAPDTTVVLRPEPASGSAFVHWEGACSGASDCTVTLSDSPSVSALFEIPNRAPLAVPAGPASGVRNEALAFDGTGSHDPDGDPLTYAWSFGDGTTAAGPTPTHAYTALGTYTVTLVVDDGMINSAPATTSVSISNLPPTVSLTAPVPGTVFTAPAEILIAAEASDPDGTVARVELWAGSSKLGEATASPYTLLWSGVPAGGFSLTARVFDESGAEVTSAPVTILVNAPPSVALTSPGAGAAFTAPASIALAATAADADGTVVGVEFFQDGTSIGVATASPFTVTWTSAPAGVYVLTARATDDRGVTVTSAPVTVTVKASLAPTADAFVRDGGYASTNYGSATSLQVRKAGTGNNRWAYLKFDTTALTSTSRVILRLYGKLSATTGTAVTTLVYPVASTSWSETGITWNNRPAAGASALASIGMVTTTTAARWYEWDVTAYVQAEKAAGRQVVSLALKNAATSTPYDVFNSRHATSNKPELLITP